jgi:hypothetical protein
MASWKQSLDHGLVAVAVYDNGSAHEFEPVKTSRRV